MRIALTTHRGSGGGLAYHGAAAVLLLVCAAGALATAAMLLWSLLAPGMASAPQLAVSAAVLAAYGAQLRSGRATVERGSVAAGISFRAIGYGTAVLLVLACAVWLRETLR